MILEVMMASVAAYTAGWLSHREWNRRHLAEMISKAAKVAAGVPVQVEYVEGIDGGSRVWPPASTGQPPSSQAAASGTFGDKLNN